MFLDIKTGGVECEYSKFKSGQKGREKEGREEEKSRYHNTDFDHPDIDRSDPLFATAETGGRTSKCSYHS